MSFVLVIPSILADWTAGCVETMSAELFSRTVVVDNTRLNHGVAGSWNLGAEALEQARADWLICCSAAVRFGPSGGEEFIEALEEWQGDAHAVEASAGLGWHLIAFPASTLARVGRFDANLWPAYEEDLDYSRRMQLAYGGLDKLVWPKVEVDARLAGVAHGIHVAHVRVDFVGLEGYMARKWNGHKDFWDTQGFTHPFNDRTKDWRWWPTPPDPRCFIPEDRPDEVPWGQP